MYSTCLYCNSDLGRNELLEVFPVGRRLAVDPKKGRLWVICPVCKRWNLSPLEERWEALEETERIVERLKPELASDNIALFTHPAGLRIVRLGGPTWRELTHWRYGLRLRARRAVAQAKRASTYIAGAAAYVGIGVLATVPLGVQAAWVVELGGGAAFTAIWNWLQERVVLRVDQGDDDPTLIRKKHLHSAKLLTAGGPGDWAVSINSDRGGIQLVDADALRVASGVLVRFNHQGAGREDLARAMRLIENAGSNGEFLGAVRRRVAERRPGFRFFTFDAGLDLSDYSGTLAHLPGATRLALEISTHDRIEQLALEGELALLDRMWREAEEIAAIADSLLIPRFVTEGIRRLRGT